jgi:hypothetical protein
MGYYLIRHRYYPNTLVNIIERENINTSVKLGYCGATPQQIDILQTIVKDPHRIEGLTYYKFEYTVKELSQEDKLLKQHFEILFNNNGRTKY